MERFPPTILNLIITPWRCMARMDFGRLSSPPPHPPGLVGPLNMATVCSLKLVVLPLSCGQWPMSASICDRQAFMPRIKLQINWHYIIENADEEVLQQVTREGGDF